MTAKVLILPVVRVDRAAAPDHPATALTKRIATIIAGQEDVFVIDALVRLIATTIACGALNDTDAIEVAEALGTDLVELVKVMRAPDAPEGQTEGVPA